MDTHKKKQILISKYLTVMIPIYCGYAVFYYFLDAKLFTYLIMSYCVIAIFSRYALRKTFNADFIINLLIILGSLLLFYIIIRLWKYTTIGCLWLLPIPLLAKLFLKRPYFTYYNIFIGILLIIILIVGEVIHISPIQINNIKMLRILDLVGIFYNIFFVSWTLYHHEKISIVEYVYDEYGINEEQQHTHTSTRKGNTATKYEEELNDHKLNSIFLQVKKNIEDERLFENPDFTLFELSAKLKINLTYVSLAIKHNGFNNFSHYLNSCRIKKVKELLQNEDMEKLTLMYIYTSCGFSSQTTFNRVFKQIEGITPSQYIKEQRMKTGSAYL